MKRIQLSSFLAVLTVMNMLGAKDGNIPVMQDHCTTKSLPIYSNDLIDEAPEGETVIGIRDCFSSYFQGGVNFRGYQKGVVGEYVMGADGNIYLRAVCYSAARISDKTDTYLKLEKVDETTYVAHTPQLIWVDESGDSPFTAYATRVVFAQKSATSFGYELEPKGDGNYDTDIYFTLTDGVLKQRNMNTVEMNGEVFPEELIGFTNSSGGWIGFGDGNLTIYQPENDVVTLPEGVAAENRSMAYTLLHVRDIELNDAALIQYAEDGDDIYITNPTSSTNMWIKGTIDRQNGNATFVRQFIGIDPESGYAVWFVPAAYSKYVEPFSDEDPNVGDWFRSFEEKDELVFDYNDGILTGTKGEAMYFSHSPEELLSVSAACDPCVKGYSEESSTPAPVTFTKFEPFDEFWEFGVIGFAIPRMNVDGEYINPDELYYNIYADDSTTPFVFTPDDYYDMEVESMVDVPYGYSEDFDFKVNGVNHTLYFYHPWNKVGVQVVRKHNGQETRSEIVYSSSLSGVESIVPDKTEKSRVYKYIRDGRIVIVRDGKEYDVMGFEIRK